MEQVQNTNSVKEPEGKAPEKKPSSQSYLFKLENFEGPLDLLLHLIRKDKVDIYDIPISEITKQYMRAISTSLLKNLDLSLAGEYLLMASSLTQIKSKMLLPQEEDDQDDADNFIADPRAELVRKLLEYQRYKDAAASLAEAPKLNDDTFKLGSKPNRLAADDSEEELVDSKDIDVFTLLTYFDNIISKLPEPEPHKIEEDRVTVTEKIISIIERLSSHDLKPLPLSSFFQVKSRAEVIVTFLSILELSRLEHISIYQPEPESEIWIKKTFDPNEIDLSALSQVESSYSQTTELQTKEEESRERSK